MRPVAQGLLAIMGVGLSVPLRAQCPDGSSPSCGRAVAHAPASNSVAVLYFETRDTVDAYLADGLTEDVATLLGSVSEVQVKPPSVMRRAQRSTPQNFPAIARALNVRYLVDGSVRRAGARLHVTVRRVVAGTTVSTWGEIFDRTPDELPSLPSIIARDVASRIAGSPAAAPAAPRTRSPVAYDHFLRGNFFLALRTPEGITRAIGEYREAERLDSGFAAAVGRAAYTFAVARSLCYNAYASARAGDTTRARALLAHWPGRTDFAIVVAVLALGDTSGALERLESAPRDPGEWGVLLRPEFDGLHRNPRSERLAATLKPAGAVGP